MDNFELLIKFAIERDIIRVRKERGESVLTEDPILSQYRFCNTHRKYDRVTKWLVENYYTEYSVDAWSQATIARLINWPPTLKYLKDNKLIPALAKDFDPVRFIDFMDERLKFGMKLYSSAYIVYPTNIVGNTKAHNMCVHIILPLVSEAEKYREVLKENSIEKFTKLMAKSFGIKTFIAGQVAADLTYLDNQLETAKDLYTWAPMGPGSQRGLNRLFNRPLKQSMKEESFLEELTQILYLLIKYDSGRFLDLNLHDVQNIMCEFDKYMRVLTKEGTPRQLYKPEWRF